MSEPRNLEDLVGGDLEPAELAQVRRADEAMRGTQAPPQVPDSLTAAVLAIPGGGSSSWTRPRRVLAGLAMAACIAGAAFGIGLWAAGGDSGAPVVEQITLNATQHAPEDAKMVIDVFPVDEAGNWAMLAQVDNLPPLPEQGFYEVWLTDGAKLSSSCGRFVVDEDGRARDVWLNAPYKLKGYERWVVTSQMPGRPPSEHMLDGPVVAPA